MQTEAPGFLRAEGYVGLFGGRVSGEQGLRGRDVERERRRLAGEIGI